MATASAIGGMLIPEMKNITTTLAIQQHDCGGNCVKANIIHLLASCLSTRL
ncbi:hypothetical protein O9929_12200 [Vibrio lentus]|nr:hypothetical protein [Vibrio lentus]